MHGRVVDGMSTRCAWSRLCPFYHRIARRARGFSHSQPSDQRPAQHLGALKALYGDYFPQPYPVRTPVQMALPLGLIMVDAIADLRNAKGNDR